MTPTHVFAGLAVSDIAAARSWYERLMGRPPDLVPNAREASWRLTETGWIYVDASRSGPSFVTVLVDDLDGWLAEVRGREIATGPVETLNAGRVRRCVITDPDGNRIAFGQAG